MDTACGSFFKFSSIDFRMSVVTLVVDIGVTFLSVANSARLLSASATWLVFSALCLKQNQTQREILAILLTWSLASVG